MFNMTPYETYIFLLCLIVFIALTALFTVMVVYIVRLMVKLIRNGVEDERIWKEYQKYHGKKNKTTWIDYVVTGVICVAMFAVFGFSVYMQVFQDSVNTDVPMYRVVLSGSMSKKDENNKYLFENNLNDQFDRFDLILTHKLPDEFDLELYDIVVYEVDDTLIVHRIVQIEEPNERHPEERWFRLQGDNVDLTDKFPVKYSQMKAIYRGERIRFVGSFFAFMQSPAGYLCILLVVLGIIAIPLMEKKIEKEELKRLRFLLMQDTEQVDPEQQRATGALCTHGSHPDCPYCNLGDFNRYRIHIDIEYGYDGRPLPKNRAECIQPIEDEECPWYKKLTPNGTGVGSSKYSKQRLVTVQVEEAQKKAESYVECPLRKR